MDHVKEFKAKYRMARHLNTRVHQRSIQEDKLVLKKVTNTKKGKIALNWEGPYRIKEKTYQWGIQALNVGHSLKPLTNII